MSTIRDDFFAAKAQGSLWDVAVSIKRGNPLPLDADSIFDSYAALEAYAADVLAYPGQLVAVVNADSTGIYYLDQNLAIQPVGVIPAGDGLSVEMGEDDVISLHNFGKAFYKYIPEVKDEETGETISEAKYEKVEVSDENLWKAGLEPKVVTEGGKLVIGWFEPNPTTIEGVNDQVTAVQGTVADLETSVGVPSAEGQEATGLYKEVEDVQEDVQELVDSVGTDDDKLGDNVKTIWAHVNDHTTRIETIETEYVKTDDLPVKGIAADDKVLSVSEALISATVSLGYDETNKAIKLYGKDSVELGSVDATPFIKDGMLDNVEYSADNNTLTFTWNTAAGKQEDTVVLSDIIEPYTAGEGLELSGNEFKVKLADGSESFLTVSADGLKLAGVADAIATAKSEAIANAATAAAGIYATQTALSDLETALDERLDVLEAYDHATYATKTELEGLGTAVAGTYATKEALKATDDKAVSNATAIENLTGRIDDIVAEGGEPNQINNIKVNGVVQPIAEDKSVDISVPTTIAGLSDWATVDGRITAAKEQADKGVTDAAAADAKAVTNAENIGKHETRIGNLETASGTYATDIANLKAADTTHAAEYSALKTTVDGHVTAIANKAEQSVVNEISAKATANETAIKTLNETTIPEVNAEIAKKANSADVYTKTEVGTIAEGKTLVQMIEEAQSAATYNDTQIKADIKANADAIDLLNGDVNTAGSVKAEAKAAADIAVATVVDSAPEAMNTLKEVADWVANDESGAAAMAKSIAANTTAIEAINNETTGILATANAYADALFGGIPAATADALGLVRADNTSIINNAGVLSVGAVSTDLLTQGAQELILNGGSATD